VIIAGERCVDPWKQWWHHRIDRHLLKSTDRMTTNTNAVVDFYQKQGIPSDRFTVIPNAVVNEAGADQRLTRDEFFQRLKLEPRKHVIGAVGRLWKQKGYQDLIWAAELIRAVNEDAWVAIVGDGPELEQLQKFRDQIDGQHIVKFLGHRSDAAELMQCFDILWNGSLYEGQSNTILEAMASGIPVLATDIPGNRDLVESERTGILYPLGDVETLSRQTLALLQDDSRRREFGENAKQRIRDEFSLDKMVASYSQLYR
ncbi:MAG: glycosyltransferase, partial [Planctomycetota bacterium]